MPALSPSGGRSKARPESLLWIACASSTRADPSAQADVIGHPNGTRHGGAPLPEEQHRSQDDLWTTEANATETLLGAHERFLVGGV